MAARITTAQLAEGQVALAQQMAEVTSALASLTSGDTPDTKPKASTKKATKPKASKPKQVTRDLDPITVACGEVSFLVRSTGMEGRMYKEPRVVPLREGGKPERSLTLAHIAAIADHGEELAEAVDTVAKRARIGEYTPATS